MEVRVLTENDAQDFWSLRLKMLEEEPDSFLATLPPVLR